MFTCSFIITPLNSFTHLIIVKFFKALSFAFAILNKFSSFSLWSIFWIFVLIVSAFTLVTALFAIFLVILYSQWFTYIPHKFSIKFSLNLVKFFKNIAFSKQKAKWEFKRLAYIQNSCSSWPFQNHTTQDLRNLSIFAKTHKRTNQPNS